jgi:NDP-sugar pyrophosphorylase family protein
VEAFIKSRKGFGVRCELSREPVLLDTGGGLKKASWFFDDGKPFILHNVDVVTELDLPAMYRSHEGLATLAVRERETKRALHFTGGRLVPPGAGGQPLAFDGVHVISPSIFKLLTEDGVFSIINAYWRLAAAGEAIRAFRSDEYEWHDIGSAAKLDKARRRREA